MFNLHHISTKICQKLVFLGIQLSHQHNNSKGREKLIHSELATVKVLVIPTNEELMIARSTLQLLQTMPNPPNPVTEFERLLSSINPE